MNATHAEVEAAERARNRERESDRALGALRSEGLARSLVVHLTGLRPGVESENFDASLAYVHANLKHHRFADSGTDAFAVRTAYEEVIERLELLSEHSKANALRALCTEVCVPTHGRGTSRGAWAWRPAHDKLGRGTAALAVLYWLSNASQMHKAPPPPLPPPSLRRRAADGAPDDIEARVSGVADVPSWGYSDDEDDDDVGGGIGLAETMLGPDEDDAAEAAAMAMAEDDDMWRVVEASASALPMGESAAWPRDATRRQPVARLGAPPAGLHLDLLSGASLRGGVLGCHPSPAILAPPALPAGAVGGPGSEEPVHDERAARLSELRILRETLRAFGGVGGNVWTVDEAAAESAAASSAHAPTATFASCGREGRELLRSQPTSALSAISPLARLASQALDIRAFAHAVSRRQTAPAVLLALADALLAELQPLLAYLWRHDEAARHAQHDVATRRAPRLHDRRRPSLLVLEDRLRRGDGGGGEWGSGDGIGGNGSASGNGSGGNSSGGDCGGGGDSAYDRGIGLGGWARKLATLGRLRASICAHPSVRALVSGSAYESVDGAAEAAGHTVDVLVSACEHEQLMGGGETNGGGENNGGDGSDDDDDGASHDAGAMTLLPLLLRLLTAALLPYLRSLQSWIGTGRLHDLAGELPVRAGDDSSPLSEGTDTEAHWAHGFVPRPLAAMPTLLRPYASQILLAGKSRHLLNRMQPSAAREAVEVRAAAAVEELIPLDVAFCLSMSTELARYTRRPSRHAPAAHASTAATHAGASTVATSAKALPALRALPTLAKADPRIYPSPRNGLLPPQHASLGHAAPSLPPPQLDAAGRPPPAGAIDESEHDQGGDHGDDGNHGNDNDPPPSSGMGSLRPHESLPSAPPAKSHIDRLLDARRGLCYLRTRPRKPVDDANAHAPTAALEAMRAALGHPPPAHTVPTTTTAEGGGAPTASRIDGRESPAVAASTLTLPPLARLLHESVVTPLRRGCAAAGPLLFTAVSAHADPRMAASLLHRVMLFSEPRLTAPLLETLFARLDVHRAWRRQVCAVTPFAALALSSTLRCRLASATLHPPCSHPCGAPRTSERPPFALSDHTWPFHL